MQMRTSLGRAIKFTTWPLLVVLAFNLENAATDAGYSSVLGDRWRDASPMISAVYEAVVSPTIFYPALVFLGAVVYEWIAAFVEVADRPGSRFQKSLIKLYAPPLAVAFRKKGFNRFTMSIDREVRKINARLESFSMPLLPPELFEDEALNREYATYLTILGDGDFEAARLYLQAAQANRQGG